MKNTGLKALVLVAMMTVAGSLLAGTLDPPGPPAPTMVTLQQIYDKLGAPAVVARTGQTGCWDAAGTPISCSGTAQDGALVKGVSASPRFTDNGNGTVTDNLTGLIWLKNANCFGSLTWTSALTSANALASGACGLTDGSVAHAWRLPNVKELQSLIDFGQVAPALPPGHPFSGVQSDYYWSSTSNLNNPVTTWNVFLGNGVVNGIGKTNTYYVWPVRGGQ